MRDNKTKTTVEVQGLEFFRKFTIFSSLIGSCISVLIVCIKPRECNTNDELRNGVIICLTVQLCIFVILLMHFIHLGCLLRKIGGFMGIFYFILTGLMTWCQLIFFKGEGCAREAVVYYWWLALNIGMFYVLIAYGLSLWGAYLCWAQQEEEELTKNALQHKFEKMKAAGVVDVEQQR